jgi:hypothetical protein
MTKNWKKFTAGKKKNFGLKTTIYLSLGLHKDVQATEEAFSSQKRTSSTSKHEISKNFPILWVIFALLDPDRDSEYGSGSIALIESGSNTDPDPKPWCHIILMVYTVQTCGTWA